MKTRTFVFLLGWVFITFTACQNSPSRPSSLLDAQTDTEIGLLQTREPGMLEDREDTLSELDTLQSSHQNQSLQRAITENVRKIS
ncbi:MAG: hypothetical protein JW893_07970 [Candidatus Omnitrophica bacterium]|nr:hypothetical protein [Candidatus Omnitrophota bacterium]